MGLLIFANLDARSLRAGRVLSANDLRSRGFRQLVAGDSTTIDLFLTGQQGLQNIQDYPTVRLGIGAVQAKPTGGTFDLGATSNLPYDVSENQLQSAITTATGANTTTQISPFVYRTEFTSTGARTLPTVDSTNLEPASTVLIQRLVEGDGSTQEVWLTRLFQNPLALVDSWTNIAGNGIRGSLSLGTVGIYALLAGQDTAQTTIELELTDTDGNITTVFQMPVTISGEVVGQGTPAIAEFGTYATSQQLIDAQTRGDYVIVSEENGSDSTGLRQREDRPFATPSAGIAATQPGDVLYLQDGNFSGQLITATDQVVMVCGPQSYGPTVAVATDGFWGTIGRFRGLQVQNGVVATVTLGAVDTNFIDWNGGGKLQLENSHLHAVASDDINTTDFANACQVRINDCKIENGIGNKVALALAGWGTAASIVLEDSTLISNQSLATSTEPSHGMRVTGTATGAIQIRNSAIIASSGTGTGATGTAYSLEANSPATIRVGGTLATNKEPSPTATVAGGILQVDSQIEA